MRARSVVFAACALFAGSAHAAAVALPNVAVAQFGAQTVSLPLQVLAFMSAITLLPAILLAMTAFTRVVIVFGLLRQALGTGQTPSNQILVGLSLFLTALIMAPVGDQAWAQGVAPYLDGKLDMAAAFTATMAPLRAFMFAQVRESDLLTFASLTNAPTFAGPADVPLPMLAASFLTSELKTAFEIGFLLYVPFVVIDLVVSSVLMSMGMMMLSPMLVSAPFKILLFVLIDGWTLVVGSLAASFHPI
jgi:flagellar biosynthetic protein FliP